MLNGNDTGSRMKPASYIDLFRYASVLDRVSVSIAIISAAIAGTGYPLCNILAGKISAVLADIDDGHWRCDMNSMKPNFTKDADDSKKQRTVQYDIERFSVLLALAGVLQLVFAYLAISMFDRVAENQAYRIRMNYIRALLRQNVGWYDLNQDSSVVSRIVEDIRKIHEATGTKLGLFIYYGINSVLCLLIAFYYGWLLTLVVLTIAPVSAIASLIVERFQSILAVKQQEQLSQCGSIIEQALINIKTVMAFSGQEKELEKYDKMLRQAEGTQVKRSVIAGLGLGLSWLFKYCSYSLTLWYGTKLVYDDVDTICSKQQTYDVEAILIILFSVLDLEYNFAQCAAFLESFSAGRGAASAIFAVIDRIPEIDSYSPDGIRGEEPVVGRIEFRNVSFSYPSRPNVKILDGLNLIIEPGMTVAFVGASGCGKSTCLQLLQRLYDPTDGTILVDGVDIRDYNLRWYRSQLAVVSQEPVLFNTTIEENIRYGNPEVSPEELEQACSLANAHEFVSRLPNKYKTVAGDRGAQLSGGQKQRIAIARALIQNPSILILDEITSALDLRTERIVHNAINKIKQGRTAIIVAHRVATLKNADLIAVIKGGRVLVQGTPKEIRQKSDLYLSSLLRSSTHVDVMGGDMLKLPEDNSGDEDEEFVETVPIVNVNEETEDEEGGAVSPEVRTLASTMTIYRIAALNKKEWPVIAIGLIVSIVHGVILPVTGFYFGMSLAVFSSGHRKKAEEAAHLYAVVFLIIGFVSFFTQLLSLTCFGCAGASLTLRLRKLIFASMMRQELQWFQQPENSVGSLCTRLSRDVASIQEATGTHLGITLGAATTIVISVGLCFYINWKLALVGWAMSPLILIGAYFNGRMVETQESMEKDAHERTSNISFQAVSNIRTVAALGLEEQFMNEFNQQFAPAHKSSKKKSHVLGIVFGTSQMTIHFAYAAVLYYGGTLVREESMKPEEDREIDYGKVFTIGEALVWTILEIGLTLAYLPNYTKAKISAARIFSLLKRKSDLVDNGEMSLDSCQGSLLFNHVNFTYKTRRNMTVLKDVSWEVKPQKRLAICGPSGSGKSTIVELILRFYDPTSGKICLDNVNLKNIKLESLRTEMAIVSQEPALFDSSLAENIAYGLSSNGISMLDIEAAAKLANIHDFIMSLPAGYSTRVGEMGAQLSGGQKQRVAIARALARTPRILLLDEATSALDAENEQAVEEAIENATVGRTCIKIAHKLESIQNCDEILVMSDGVLVEVGTHDELMKKKGLYFNLWTLQAKQIS